MTKRNVSLDTLRCLAIVMVVCCHTASQFGEHGENGWVGVLRLGGRGVNLFFVLSGWLLGYALLAELKRSGGLDVRRFWLRRWLRTLPAYYAVLLFTYAWQLFGRTDGHIYPSFLFFGQTYAFSNIPYFVVSWSLCVEEHFYLAVAPLLLLLFRFPKTRLLAIPLLLTPSLCRYMGWYGAEYETHVNWDQCAAGVLLAWAAVFRPQLWQGMCKAAPYLFAVALGVAGYNVAIRLWPQWGCPDPPAWAWYLSFVCFVLLAVSNDFWRQRASVFGCRFIAERAYSLYLVHVEALAIVKRLPIASFPLRLAVTWIISLMIAEILYRTIERPLMQARERLPAARSHAPELVPVAPVAETPTPTTVPEATPV